MVEKEFNDIKAQRSQFIMKRMLPHGLVVIMLPLGALWIVSLKLPGNSVVMLPLLGLLWVVDVYRVIGDLPKLKSLNAEVRRLP